LGLEETTIDRSRFFSERTGEYSASNVAGETFSDPDKKN